MLALLGRHIDYTAKRPAWPAGLFYCIGSCCSCNTHLAVAKEVYSIEKRKPSNRIEERDKDGFISSRYCK